MIKNSRPFEAMHINANAEDFMGNGEVGRYLLLPGSDGRAKAIAEQFEDLEIKPHRRQHNLYLGNMRHGNTKIAVASLSSGMGCPSMDIIATEALELGIKRIIRVGTAGSLQSKTIKTGSLVLPTAAVRDEGTSRHYLASSIPVQPSLEFLDASRRAAQKLDLTRRVYTGPIHTKDSLYAREFGAGPLSRQNQLYMDHLREVGILASEMECAQLFALQQIWNAKQLAAPAKRSCPVFCGAILAIIGDDEPFSSGDLVTQTTNTAIALALETIRQWYDQEDKKWQTP